MNTVAGVCTVYSLIRLADLQEHSIAPRDSNLIGRGCSDVLSVLDKVFGFYDSSLVLPGVEFADPRWL